MKKFLAGVATLALACAVAAGSATAAPPGSSVVASGLDNPRGLAFDPRGALYVAEAGRGGPGPCVTLTGAGLGCYGPTGAVTQVFGGAQRRVVTGLPSHAPPGGFAATGPHDVSVLAPGWRVPGLSPPPTAYIAMGLGGTPAERAALGPGAALLGQLVRTRPDLGIGVEAVADFAAYEQAANPDGGDINANPNAVLAREDVVYVVDAGANTLNAVSPSGAISVVAVFPRRLVPAPPFLPLPPGAMIPMESVPDSIVRGSDGALYVGELTGFPFPRGGARVYRVVPGQAPQVYASGFTNIIDIAFDKFENLYVLEIDANSLLLPGETGRLVRVSPDGVHETIASEGLVMPGGLALDHAGNIYVSNFGIFPGAGEVVRFPARTGLFD